MGAKNFQNNCLLFYYLSTYQNSYGCLIKLSIHNYKFVINLVPEVGVEPTSLARHDFKSCAYTNSATRAIYPKIF